MGFFSFIKADIAKETSNDGYSRDTLNIILKTEELLHNKLFQKAFQKLESVIDRNNLNKFEKASLFFLLGSAQRGLEKFADANKSLILVFKIDGIPINFYREALKSLSNDHLNNTQKTFILSRLKVINKHRGNIELLIMEGQLLYDFGYFNDSIKVLETVINEEELVSKTQIEKINELKFLAHIGNSEFDIALDIIKTTVLNNPVKLNFRRLAYTYALLNDNEKHMNIWETIHDNFEINRYETRFFYELLLKNKFYLKATEVFSIGLKKGFFDEQERYEDGYSKY